MSTNYSEILKEFLIGGTTVAGISYLGNYVDPILAGLLAGIPMGLPTIYFIQQAKAEAYIRNLSFTTVLLCITTLLYYYLFVKLNVGKNIGIVYTMSFWFISIIAIYYIEKSF